MARLIYIGGYGRSGSTLFESLLTADPNLVACGEVGRHLWRTKTRKTCTCGRWIKKCPVWQPFRHKRKRFDDWDHPRLTLALLEHISSSFSVMVDSSKTSWGSGLVPFRLHKKLGRDFLLIHLVRDPRAVFWSTLRTMRQNRRKEPGTELGRYLRTVFGWMGANLACEAFGFLYPDRYLRIRYEDIVRSPQVTLPSIFEAASLQPSRVDRAVASDNRHQLHGNRVRRKPALLATLNEDVAWKAQMPAVFRRLTIILTVPFFLRYGYFRSAPVQRQWPKKASATESPPVS